MPQLLPLPNHLWHTLHRNPPLLHPLPQRPLPVLPLHFPPLARPLHPQPVLYPLLLFYLGMLGTERHQGEDVMRFRFFKQLSLLPERVDWRMPFSCSGIFPGGEGVGFLGLDLIGRGCCEEALE